MNDDQYTRYKRLKNENIKCLISIADKKGNFHFLLDGSQGVHYKVSISQSGKINCSCPDFIHNAKKFECVCKHCLCVILDELRLFDIHHTFFSRCFFTKDEIESVNNAFKHLKTIP